MFASLSVIGRPFFVFDLNAVSLAFLFAAALLAEADSLHLQAVALLAAIILAFVRFPRVAKPVGDA